MKQKTAYLIVLLFFIISVVFKLFFAFLADSYSYEAYDVIRNIESIKDTGKPLYYDPLAYGGRENVFPPIYFYLLSAFSFVFNMGLVIKILPVLFSSALVFVMYAFVYEVTRNKTISLVSSFISMLIPIFFAETLLSASIYSLFIPLMLLCLFLFLNITKPSTKSYFGYTFFVLIFSILLHPSSFVIILGFVFYLILSKILIQRADRREIEMVIFSIFFFLWFYFVLYKKAFLAHGFNLIWQNLPSKLISDFFVHISLIQIMEMLGLLVSLLAIFSIYHSIFVIKKKNLLLITSVILSCLLLLLFRLLTLEIGLMFLAVLFMVHAGYALKLIYDYLKKTKAAKFAKVIVVFIILMVFFNLVASLLSSLTTTYSDLPSDEDIKVFEWIRRNTPHDATILARPEEGYALAAISKRHTVMDYNFLLIENADERFNDLDRVFQLRTKAEAVGIFDKYGVDYVLLSSSTQHKEGLNELFYGSERDCFRLVYDNISKLYMVKCTVHKN